MDGRGESAPGAGHGCTRVFVPGEREGRAAARRQMRKDGSMVRRCLVVLGAAALGMSVSASPAAAQAKGSADAAAARRADPHWKAPRNAFGQPDLEGTWTTDDMRGIPMSRPAQFG